MELPLRVGVPRPQACGLPLTELLPPGEAPELLGGGPLRMALTALVRVAQLAAGGLRPVGLSRLGGVAQLPEAESRRALLPLGGVARLTGADLRRVGMAGVALPLVAGCRPMELLTSGGV